MKGERLQRSGRVWYSFRWSAPSPRECNLEFVALAAVAGDRRLALGAPQVRRRRFVGAPHVKSKAVSARGAARSEWSTCPPHDRYAPKPAPS